MLQSDNWIGTYIFVKEEQSLYDVYGYNNAENDLLFSDNLTKSDIDKVKKLSVELLQKIKERIAGMDHWTDKDETKATVQNLIRDLL